MDSSSVVRMRRVDRADSKPENALQGMQQMMMSISSYRPCWFMEGLQSAWSAA